MFAATESGARGFLFGLPCRQDPCRARHAKADENHVGIEGDAEDCFTGAWFIVAGHAGAVFRGERGAECLTVVRSESRSIPQRILDRLTGRDRYRVLWHDGDCGHCVIARADRSKVLILSRKPAMQTRELFQRVADLRRLGFDTRPLQYAHVV